jgi:hypothetical protein
MCRPGFSGWHGAIRPKNPAHLRAGAFSGDTQNTTESGAFLVETAEDASTSQHLHASSAHSHRQVLARGLDMGTPF